jgi:hypothetical protein
MKLANLKSTKTIFRPDFSTQHRFLFVRGKVLQLKLLQIVRMERNNTVAVYSSRCLYVVLVQTEVTPTFVIEGAGAEGD